jgi:hypothetical protein
MRLIVKSFCSSTDETVPNCATVTGAAARHVAGCEGVQAQMARDNAHVAEQQGSPRTFDRQQ